MRFRSRERSKQKAEPRSSCARAIAGLKRKRSKRITGRSNPSARVEKIFGTWKRSYHLRAMQWIGLAKAKLQVHLAAIAYNLKRYWRLQNT
jgi:IS5 family transposase